MIYIAALSARKTAALSSSSTQPAVEVEDAIVGKTVGRQKQSGIGNLCRICHSVERRIFEVGLLDFWLKIL